jgi:hypothetical protein
MTGPDDAQLRQIVEAACTAASLHNTQPWRWVAHPDRLELWADWSRHLRRTDRAGRDLLVSCGAALHTATVAAAGAGWAASVRRFPDPAEHELLAALTFTPSRPTPTQVELGDAVHRRRTDRREVSSWSVPDEWVQTLSRVANAHGVLLTGPLDDGQARLIHQLHGAARRTQDGDPECLQELQAWTCTAAPEGVPAENLPSAEAQRRPGGMVHRFPPGSLPDDYRESAEPAPLWLVLATSSDDPIAWLRTGEALAAVWLTATVGGMALLPLSQAIEVPVTRRRLQDEVLDDVAYPQLVVRLGWPPVSRDVVPPTLRRSVDEVLTFAQEADSLAV